MREIDVKQVATALEGGGRVIDVRETGEDAEGHVPGTVNVLGGTGAWIRSGRPVARGVQAGAQR